MEGRVYMPRACHSSLEILETLQGNPVDDITINSAGKYLSLGRRDRSVVGRDLAGGTTPSPARKRQLDTASIGDLLPAKRTRLAEQLSPAILLWQRHINSDDGNRSVKGGSGVIDNTHTIQQVQAQLTRRNLALFNKMTTEEGTDDEPQSSPLESTAKTLATKTKSTSSTMSSFAKKTYKNGILPPFISKPPTNLNERHKRAASSRGTASPTLSEYKSYVITLPKAFNEVARGIKVGKTLQKSYDDESYQQAFNQAFTGFPKDVGFNNGLSPPQPDFVEGLGVVEFEPFPIEHVSGAVLYKDNPLSTALPHIAGEYKGPGGSMEKARLQCAYDGAALVYARNKALALIGKPDPLGHAKITTFATDGKNIDFFAHYAARGDDGKLKYHQYPIGSCVITNSHYGYKDCWRHLQNEQDYAREQSYALRDQLVNHWEEREGIAPLTPRSCHIGDLNSTQLEPWPKTRTGIEEGCERPAKG